MDYRIQVSHQFLIAFAEFTESLGLCLEKVRDGFWTIAGVDLDREGMCV
jgi:hypothetical protein